MPQNSSAKWLLWASFYKCGNWGSEQLNTLSPSAKYLNWASGWSKVNILLGTYYVLGAFHTSKSQLTLCLDWNPSRSAWLLAPPWAPRGKMQDNDAPGGEVSAGHGTAQGFSSSGHPSPGSPPPSPNPHAAPTLRADTVGRSISGELAIILWADRMPTEGNSQHKITEHTKSGLIKSAKMNTKEKGNIELRK